METELQRMYRIHAEVLKAMANPHRLGILDHLRHGEGTVGDLADAMELTISNTSQHLSVLKAAGIVRKRKEGTTCYYRVSTPTIFQAFDCMGKFLIESREDEAEHREFLRSQVLVAP